jgi:hypothetical protein
MKGEEEAKMSPIEKFFSDLVGLGVIQVFCAQHNNGNNGATAPAPPQLDSDHDSNDGNDEIHDRGGRRSTVTTEKVSLFLLYSGFFNAN